MKISASYIFKSIIYFILRVLYLLSRQFWFRPILRFMARVFKRKKDVCFNVHGHKMYGNTMDRIAAILFWKYSTLEDYETLLMAEKIKAGMTVLDIGANIGYHTLKISKWVGKTGRVIAFEPDPENYRLLQKNLQANNCKNVEIVQKAVSNKSGELKLYFCEENRGDHRIFDSRDDRKSFSIQSVLLDEHFSDGIDIDVIKIDIQGAEPQAFEGMRKIVEAQDNLMVFCEFFPDVFQYYGYSAQDFLTLLGDYGFSINVINDHTRSLTVIPNEDLIRSCKGEKYVNLLLQKGSA